MAQFIRGKQSGVQGNLSEFLAPELFAVDDIIRYGVNHQVSAIAYDPVQSLLAIGTKESRTDTGRVYIFGQARVNFSFEAGQRTSVTNLQFSADKLLVLDSKGDLTVFSLPEKRVLTKYSPPGLVTCMTCDPTLDYAFLGLQSGNIIIYDLDRQGLAQLKIPNLWKDIDPRSRSSQVISFQLHPRDVGTLLVAYPEGLVIFSFKQNKVLNSCRYELPIGAPGGYSDPSVDRTVRRPKVVQIAWHPTGTFILSAHDDESLVIWDAKTGTIVQARTTQDTNVDKPGTTTRSFGNTAGTYALKSPIVKIAWCSKQNPEDTGLLIAGGVPSNVPEKGITFFDLGLTPIYATSSWQILSDHFATPKKTSLLRTPAGADVVDFCIIPRATPHYLGASDPIAIIALLTSGELATLSFPSGYPISPANQLHVSLSFVHPFIDNFSVGRISRTRWLGMVEKRSQGPLISKGGAEGAKPLKRFEARHVFVAAHADATVRLWDAGFGDEIENPSVIQADVAKAIGRHDDLSVVQTSFSGAIGELAVGLASGEVLIFRWGAAHGSSTSPATIDKMGMLPLQGQHESSLRQGLLPLTMYRKRTAPVTALKLSDVGFVAAGYQDGSIVVMDLRGPAVIFEGVTSALSAQVAKRGVFGRGSVSNVEIQDEWPTRLEFGVLTIDNEDFSSILLFVGTNTGRLLTYQIIPDTRGGYVVEPIESTNVESEVVAIHPLDGSNGLPLFATPDLVAQLRTGLHLPGVLVVVTHTQVRVFRPPNSKGASKSFGDVLCLSAAVVRDEDERGTALVALLDDGSCRTYSLPGLKELTFAKVDRYMNPSRFRDAVVTSAGAVIGWRGPSEIAMVNPWGSGVPLTPPNDPLFNPAALIPPRPTISNLQWISGTQFLTPSDLDILIGGPNRPPSKRMLEQLRAEELQRKELARSGTSSSAGTLQNATAQDEGYWSYMSKQIQQRTERLNIMGDSLDRLNETSQNWAEDVGKYVNDQKKKAIMGIVTSKLGF